MPGDDPSGNDVISKAITGKLHNPKVIAEYKVKMAEINEESLPQEINGIIGKAVSDLDKFNFQAIKEFSGRMLGLKMIILQ